MRIGVFFNNVHNAVRLTFIDDLKVNLSMIAEHIGSILHLASVGAIKGWRNLLQGDGGIPLHDIAWPHNTAFEEPLLLRIWGALVVKNLTQSQK